MKIDPKLQTLIPPLRPEERDSLHADIEARGVLVPIEVDGDGYVLDGHTRLEIATALGKPYKTITRHFADKTARLEHVINLNLCRRHLDALRWGQLFEKLLEARGVKRGEASSASKQHRAKRIDVETCEAATVAALAKAAGVSPRTARHRVALAGKYDKLPKKQKKAVDEGKQTVSAAYREQKREAVVRKVREIPSDKYRVIYADPPWKYGDTRDSLPGTTGATAHYPCMSIPELCALPIAELADENAVLFLWVTSPLLAECWPVIKAWGFSYRTSMVWNKLAHNMGHYCSVRHEFLLICVRGSCLPDIKELLPSVVAIKRGKHSEKPEEFRKMIDKMYPHGKRIELFARKELGGKWDTWGNE